VNLRAHQLAPGLAGTNYVITQTDNEQANAGGGTVINQHSVEAWKESEQAYKTALAAKDQTIAALEVVVEMLKKLSEKI
jgi:hypothetical protein